MGAKMNSPKQKNEPARMTLDELFRKTFSSLLASLMDTFNIFEEQPSPKDPPKDSGS
jgi:hypothetical protein